MGTGDRTVQGSALRIAARQGASRPGLEVEDAMSTGIRELSKAGEECPSQATTMSV